MASKQSGETGKSSRRGGSGNFANDPERASEAGRKGGEHSHGGKSQSGSDRSSGKSGRGGSGSGSGSSRSGSNE
jgi:general stress protein YciG